MGAKSTRNMYSAFSRTIKTIVPSCITLIVLLIDWMMHGSTTVRFKAILSSVACLTLQYFSTFSHKRHDFRKKKITEHKKCFDLIYNFCLKLFSLQEELSEIWSKMYIGVHVKYRLFLLDFSEILYSLQIVEKYSNTRFHENPSSGSRDVACGQTDMTKIKVDFRHFANAPKTKTTEWPTRR